MDILNDGYYAKYVPLKDEDIIALVQQGDNRALEYIIEKYKGLVRAKTRSYFMIGSDKEDIIQEGMIGLYKAIRDFKVEKQANFYSFAELCITRQVITAIKTANRQKHQPLNSYISLNCSVYDENDECTYVEFLRSETSVNPETMVIENEEKERIDRRIGEVLSSFEKKVLALYLSGKSYIEIAKRVNKDEKSVDNALQRIKKKVEKIVNEKS